MHFATKYSSGIRQQLVKTEGEELWKELATFEQQNDLQLGARFQGERLKGRAYNARFSNVEASKVSSQKVKLSMVSFQT